MEIFDTFMEIINIRTVNNGKGAIYMIRPASEIRDGLYVFLNILHRYLM